MDIGLGEGAMKLLAHPVIFDGRNQYSKKFAPHHSWLWSPWDRRQVLFERYTRLPKMPPLSPSKYWLIVAATPADRNCPNPQFGHMWHCARRFCSLLRIPLRPPLQFVVRLRLMGLKRKAKLGLAFLKVKSLENLVFSRLSDSGEYRVRTGDLLNAIQARSQLRQSPKIYCQVLSSKRIIAEIIAEWNTLKS